MSDEAWHSTSWRKGGDDIRGIWCMIQRVSRGGQWTCGFWMTKGNGIMGVEYNVVNGCDDDGLAFYACIKRRSGTRCHLRYHVDYTTALQCFVYSFVAFVRRVR